MAKPLLAVLALLATTAALAAVDVNQATEAELDSVKGIGPGTSRVILQERRKGDFRSWDDFITRVKGLGPARAGHLSDAGLTVGGKGYTPSAVAPRPAASAATTKK